MPKLSLSTASRTKLLIPEDITGNNFNFIRFLLAASVIYCHCYVLTYYKFWERDPFYSLTNHQADLGEIAVDCFFMISGFMIIRSFINSKNILDYLNKRVLRIVPGFVVAYLASVFIFGFLGTVDKAHLTGQWKLYIESVDSNTLIKNFLILSHPPEAKTFELTYLKHAINQSLWSIQYEFLCYLIIPLIFLKFIKQNKWVALIAFVAAYLLFAIQTNYQSPDHKNDLNLWNVLDMGILLKVSIYFLAGVCFYYYRYEIKRTKLLAILSIISLIICAGYLKAINLALPIAGTYLLFYIAYHLTIKLHKFGKKRDLSYGIYLYGWPVQQLVMQFFAKHLNYNSLFLIAFPIVILIAYLSWTLIESPFLNRKKERKIIEEFSSQGNKSLNEKILQY